MGVKLLHTFLKKHVGRLAKVTEIPAVAPQPPDDGSSPIVGHPEQAPAFHTILVDAHGFLISLAEEVICRADACNADQSRMFPDADIVGGDMQAVHAAMVHLVTRLRDVYRVQLIFAVDAPRGLQGPTSDRDDVWDNRAKEQREALLQRVEYCRGKTPHKYVSSTSRRTNPLMLTGQLYSTLRALNVPVLQLDDEVDRYIGALVFELKPVCVFTGDTDFVVTPNIPVVLSFDFPWDAMLHGWQPAEASAAHSHDTPSPTPQDPPIRLFIFDAGTLAQYLNLSADELYLAASLCGNDITSDFVAAKNSEDGKRSRAYMITDAAREVAQHYRTPPSADRGEGSEPVVDAAPEVTFHDAFLSALPEVMRCSILRYREAAQFVPYAPRLDADTLAVFESLVANHLPVTFIGILRTGFMLDDPTPLLDGVFGFVHDVFTFKKVRHAVAHVLGRTSLCIFERGELRTAARISSRTIDRDSPADVVEAPQAAEAPNSVLRFRDESVDLPQEVIACLPRDWRAAAAVPSAEERVMALGPLFTMYSGRSLSLLRPRAGARVVTPPPSIILVLWVLHAACTSPDEIRRIVEMIVIVHMSEHGDQTAKRVLRDLPLAAPQQGEGRASSSNVLRKRPSVRTLELSRLFATAYSEVNGLLKLLHVREDVAFPDPVALFSGTLLHTLDTHSPLSLDFLHRSPAIEGCSNDALGEIITAIDELFDLFRTSFEITTYRPPKGNDGLRVVAVDCVYNWAGMLQRDEMIDLLEAGGQSRTQLRVAAQAAAGAPARQQLPTPQSVLPTGDALPIDEHIPALLQAIEHNRVVCVQGDTGCGKSSIIPLQLYLDAVKRKRRVQIVVTQPRRLAAVALATRVANLLGGSAGGTVGYRLGGGVRVESERTRIFFVTSGYLLECLVHGSNIWSRTTHLLLDEVHERSLDADMLSLVIRLMLQHDDEVDTAASRLRAKRLVIMSATIQAELFMNYFRNLQWYSQVPKQHAHTPAMLGELEVNHAKMPLLHVGGHRMHVEVRFLPEVLEQLRSADLPKDVITDLNAYHDRIKRVSSRKAFALQPQDIRAICFLILACVKPSTCVLVFLPGLKEIEDCFEELSNRRVRSPVNLRVHALHSIVDGDEQARVLISADTSECKVVLSTNIAETSITIPDVKVVIDLGFARRVAYDEAKRLRCIQAVWCSRAAAKQRAGRAGRVSNGLVLRLYSKQIMDAIMPEFESSDCFPLEASVLQVRQHLGQFGSVEALMQQLVEPPSTTAVQQALARLVEWGALGPGPRYDVLALGEVATTIPVDVALTKAIMLASRFGCAADMTVIACGLTLQRAPYRLPMRTFYDSDVEFQQHVMRAFRSVSHFDRQQCNDLYQYMAIVEEALAWTSNTHDFCAEWYLSFRQVCALLQTVRLLSKRLLAAADAGKLQLTADDRSRMAALSEKKSSVVVRFPALHETTSDELLQLVLSYNCDRIIVSQAESEAKKFHSMLAASSLPAAASGSWSSSADDFVLFKGMSKEAVSVGATGLLDRLKAFGVTECVLGDRGHGIHSAIARIPRVQSDMAGQLEPHAMAVGAGLGALCRMGRLHPSKKWIFSSSSIDGAEAAVILPKPVTMFTVKRWQAIELPDALPTPPPHPSPRAEVDSDNPDQRGKRSKVKEKSTTIQIDRWAAIGSNATTMDRRQKPCNFSLLGFAFNIMSATSTLIASSMFLMRAARGFPLVALLSSRRSAQLPPMIGLTVCPHGGNHTPTVECFETNIPAYDAVLRQLNGVSISAVVLLELNLVRILLHHTPLSAEDEQRKGASDSLPSPDAIVRALNTIRGLCPSSHRDDGDSTPDDDGYRVYVYAAMYRSKVVLYDLAELVDCAATNNAVWASAVDVYRRCLCGGGSLVDAFSPLPTAAFPAAPAVKQTSPAPPPAPLADPQTISSLVIDNSRKAPPPPSSDAVFVALEIGAATVDASPTTTPSQAAPLTSLSNAPPNLSAKKGKFVTAHLDIRHVVTCMLSSPSFVEPRLNRRKLIKVLYAHSSIFFTGSMKSFRKWVNQVELVEKLVAAQWIVQTGKRLPTFEPGPAMKLVTPPPVDDMVSLIIARDVLTLPFDATGETSTKKMIQHFLSLLEPPWQSAPQQVQDAWVKSSWGKTIVQDLVTQGWLVKLQKGRLAAASTRSPRSAHHQQATEQEQADTSSSESSSDDP